jgi:hypothetical protein
MVLTIGSLLYATLQAAAAPASGPTYNELRAAAVAGCQKIDPSDYQSGLFFNPDGYRSYYVQSECFQRTAVEFRDQTLCSLVKQRRAFFSSSWGYSPQNCLKLVTQGAAADRAALEDIKRRYLQGPMRLRDFRLERNGNGRDFDILPIFSGEFGHGYVLQFELLTEGNVLVARSGHYLDATSNIRLFVRHSDLLARIPRLTRDRPYRMRATLLLDVGNGGPPGRWSDAFIEAVFPARDRSHSIDKDVRF